MSAPKSSQKIAVPEGFAVGTAGPDNQPYIMPHYMVPGYEHSLLVEGIRDQSAPTSAAADRSPYTEEAAASMHIPEDAVSPFFYLIFNSNVARMQPLSPEELLLIHRWIEETSRRDGVSYAEALARLYAAQMECLKVADEEVKAWQNLSASVKIAALGVRDHVRQDP